MIAGEVKKLMNGEPTTCRGVRDIMTLKDDKSIGWTKDKKWDELMRLGKVLATTSGTQPGLVRSNL